VFNMTTLRDGWPRVRFSVEASYLAVGQQIQTPCGKHPASHSMGTASEEAVGLR